MTQASSWRLLLLGQLFSSEPDNNANTNRELLPKSHDREMIDCLMGFFQTQCSQKIKVSNLVDSECVFPVGTFREEWKRGRRISFWVLEERDS